MAQIDLKNSGVGDALDIVLDLFGTELVLTKTRTSLDAPQTKSTLETIGLFQYNQNIMKAGRWTKVNTILVASDEDYTPEPGDTLTSDLGNFVIGEVIAQGVGQPIGYLCEIVS